MAEQRLIDANALMDWLTKATGFRTSCDDCTDIDCLDCIIEEAIKNAPTIEAKPVVHAHWLEQIIDGGQELMCSNCGEYALMNDEFYSEFSKYCPYCGAQMDEKENDNG